MLQRGWSLFCGHLQNICFVLSLVFNCFVIYLIFKKSPKTIGNYKYLMLYVAFFEISYALLATVTKPFVHSYSSRVISIVDLKNSWFDREITSVLNSCICGFYGCSVVILALHFMYRYGSLHKVRSTTFEGYRLVIWCLVPVIYGIIWGLTMHFIFPEDKEFTDFIRKDIWDYFELKVEDIVYTGPYYYTQNKKGLGNIEPIAIFGMMIFWFIIGSSFFVVIYFGVNCYLKIKKYLGHYSSASTKELQQQLFRALVWQTVIPLVMLYIPISIVFICPLFQIDIGNSSAFISYSVAVYPVIDTLPTIFLIKNFRKAVFDLFCCLRYSPTIENTSKIAIPSLTTI